MGWTVIRFPGHAAVHSARGGRSGKFSVRGPRALAAAGRSVVDVVGLDCRSRGRCPLAARSRFGPCLIIILGVLGGVLARFGSSHQSLSSARSRRAPARATRQWHLFVILTGTEVETPGRSAYTVSVNRAGQSALRSGESTLRGALEEAPALKMTRLVTCLLATILGAMVLAPSALARPAPLFSVALSVDTSSCSAIVLNARLDWSRVRLTASRITWSNGSRSAPLVRHSAPRDSTRANGRATPRACIRDIHQGRLLRSCDL